jgi:hypothetical protein
MYRVSDIRQIEIHTAEPLVPAPSPFAVEIVIVKFIKYKLPHIDQILAKLIQARGETLHSEIHNSLILFGIRTNFLSSGRSPLLYQFTRWAIKLTVVIIEACHLYQFYTEFCLKVKSIHRQNYWRSM